MKQIGIDPELGRRLAVDGFATVTLPEAAVAQLRDRVEELDRTGSAGAGNESSVTYKGSSFDHPDPAFRRSAMATVLPLLAAQLDRYFEEQAPLLAGYFIKRPGAGALPVHRDWTMTTDPRETLINIWCPLVDVDETNGAMALVPGSHLFRDHICGPGIPVFWARHGERLKSLSVVVPARAGEVVIFDNRTLHWTFANRSDASRPVAILTYMPRGATAGLFRPAGSDATRFEIVDMSPDGYVAEGAIGCLPGAPARPSIGTMPNRNRPIAWEEYEAAARAGAAGANWESC